MAKELTEAQRAALEEVKANRAARQKMIDETPTQRTRAIAQGLTFGFADEIEAAIRSLGGREYQDLLDETRGVLKEYQAARPGEALGFELGGAVLPSVIAGLFTGGAGTAAGLGNVLSKAPTLAKVVGMAAPRSVLGAAGVGAAQGALTGIGKGETAEERMTGGALGAVGGAALGAGIQAALPAVTNKISAVTDYARRKLGGKASSAVTNELQRLMNESGLTADEVIDGVASGRIMTENKTLMQSVRAIYAKGGKGATKLEETLTARAPQARQAATEQMQRSMSDIQDPNVLRAIQADDDAARVLERQAYKAFEGVPVNKDVEMALEDAINSVPEAGAALNRIFRARGGNSPFFIREDGTIVFARTPNVDEAELVRRTLSNMARSEFKGGVGTVGEALSEVEGRLRSAIDTGAAGVAEARASAAMVRGARDAFDTGRKALGQSADQVAIDFAKIAEKPEIAKSYRAGVLQAIKDKMTLGSKASMMGKLVSPEDKMGMILRTVVPEDELPAVLRSIENAAASQEARNVVLGGSQTAVTQQRAAREGSDMGLLDFVDIAQGGLNIAGLARTLGRFAKRAAPELSDKQREQVVDVLISQDPEFVRRALTDEGGLAMLQQAIENLLTGVTTGVSKGATTTGQQEILQPRRNK